MNKFFIAAALAAAGGVVRVLPGLGERKRRVEETVPVEMRTPLLYLSLPTTSDKAVRRIRRLPLDALTRMPDGVVKFVLNAKVAGRETLQVQMYTLGKRARPSPCVLWIHGGGYVIGSAAMSQSTGGVVARELGVLVVSPEYRLAPEHPFPAALEDCYTALKWIHDNAEQINVDPGRIAIAGESAGGGLAAALAQLAHDRGEVPIQFQLLVSPMLDDRTVLREMHHGTGEFVWTPDKNEYGWTAYLGQRPQVHSAPEYAAAARREDLSGLPPAWIGVGDLDLFYAEDLEYARRLEAAGVDVEVHVVPGMPHAVDTMVKDSPAVDAFNQSKVEALRRALLPAEATTDG